MSSDPELLKSRSWIRKKSFRIHNTVKRSCIREVPNREVQLRIVYISKDEKENIVNEKFKSSELKSRRDPEIQSNIFKSRDVPV